MRSRMAFSKKFETRIARQASPVKFNKQSPLPGCARPGLRLSHIDGRSAMGVSIARLCLAPCRARSARRGSEAAAPQGARGKPLLEGDRLVCFDRIVTVASRALFLNLLSSNFGCEQANSIIFSQFCFINLVLYSL